MAYAKRQAKAVVAAQMKRDKTPPQSVDTDPRMSLEGRGLDRDRDPVSSNKEAQVKKKPRKAEALKGNLPPPKLRSGPLGYEPGVERRPSIERGGTNTIEMEVSGIGSRGSSRGKEKFAVQDLPSSSQPQPPPQPQPQTHATTKENSCGRKRQKRSPVAAAVEETDTAAAGGIVQSVGQYSSTTTKPPVPPTSMERSTNTSLSAPVKNAQKKVKKSRQHSHQASSQESGYGTAGDETPSRRTSYGTTVSDMDSSMTSGGGGGGGGGNGSPGESQLIELQPFGNPEQGLRESIAKIGSEDWSAKCDGMIGIRQVAMYHPAVLQPQLHSVVLAVQKEVYNVNE